MATLSQIEEEDNEIYAYVVLGAICIGFLLLLTQLYYANYDLVQRLHIDIPFLDKHVFSKEGMKLLLGDSYKVRNVVLFLFAFSLTSPSKGEKPTSFWRQLAGLGISVAVFHCCRFFLLIPLTAVGQSLNILGSLISAVCILSYCGRITRFYLAPDRSLNENERLADGFEQTTELIETPTSVNWKYEFSYQGKTHTGYINELAVYRASFVIGMPGTGKSHSFLDPAMKQLIAKHFSAVVYDYKDPTLSNAVYQYYVAYKREHPASTLRFGYLSYVNINHTYRCNPMKGISTSAEAVNSAITILTALNKNFVEKQGEFFTESAKSYTAIVIYALGVLFGGRYLSLPHTLTMLSQVPSVLFPVLKLISVLYPDMKTLFSPFKEAYDTNTLPQLQGQLASAQIGLGAMSDASLAYVMTEDEESRDIAVDLDTISSKESPMLLCLGSNPRLGAVLGLANAVYLTRIANLLNRKGRNPTAFFADEVVTTYINGLDNLIATARSNKIAVFLGFQDFSQMVRDYGQKIADAIVNTVNNVFVGAVKGKTAKELAESFGKKTVKKISKSITEEGKVTTSIAEHKEDRITQSMIEELSQGEFVGRVADEYGKEIKCKVFHGKVIVETPEKEQRLREELESQAKSECESEGRPYLPDETPWMPKVRNWSDEEIKRRLRLNMIKINNEVSDVLLRLNEIADTYKILTHLTTGDDEFCLRHYLADPQNPQKRINLFVWLEEAYRIVWRMEELELKDDILSSEEKFLLLLRDVYTTSYEGLQQILKAREQYHAMDLNSVKLLIDEYEDEYGTNLVNP